MPRIAQIGGWRFVHGAPFAGWPTNLGTDRATCRPASRQRPQLSTEESGLLFIRWLRLLLLLDLGLGGWLVNERIEPNHIVLTVAVGLFCQTQVGERQALILSLLEGV